MMERHELIFELINLVISRNDANFSVLRDKKESVPESNPDNSTNAGIYNRKCSTCDSQVHCTGNISIRCNLISWLICHLVLAITVASWSSNFMFIYSHMAIQPLLLCPNNIYLHHYPQQLIERQSYFNLMMN